uniref:Uncharacterized protein n=1 Tax=Arundo donax TaxID=35708 RepID=A0A0A8YJ36_ARUDO
MQTTSLTAHNSDSQKSCSTHRQNKKRFEQTKQDTSSNCICNTQVQIVSIRGGG